VSTELQAAALEYVTAGLHIIALTGKRPNSRVHGGQWSYENSFHGTLQSPAEIEGFERSFTTEAGTTGIAILIPPDFLVADVDTERAATLLNSLGFEPTESTVVAQTKNGFHFWFWWPGADRNRWIGDGQLPDPGRTLLFKGLSGYVVAPPSLHFDAAGRPDAVYSWITSLVSGGTRFMPDPLPHGVAERFALSDQSAELRPEKEQMTVFTMKPAEGVPWWQWEKVWEYQTAGLERAIEKAADGNQNNVIHWAAMTAREEGVPREVAMERLLEAAIKGGHPSNRARDTIRGAYKQRAPRG
jgi:hypothetical protein